MNAGRSRKISALCFAIGALASIAIASWVVINVLPTSPVEGAIWATTLALATVAEIYWCIRFLRG